MVVAVLQRLSHVLQAGLVALELVVDHSYQVVDQAVFLVGNETVPEEFLSREQYFLIVVVVVPGPGCPGLSFGQQGLPLVVL